MSPATRLTPHEGGSPQRGPPSRRLAVQLRSRQAGGRGRPACAPRRGAVEDRVRGASAHPQAAALLARRVGAQPAGGRRRATQKATSSTDTTRLAAVGSSSRPSRMKGTPSTPNASTASALSPAPHRRERSTSRVPTNHGTGANASVAGTSASTTDAASRVTVAASSQGGPPVASAASSAGPSGVDGGHGVAARLGDQRGRATRARRGRARRPGGAVRAGIASRVGEVVLDAGAQLGAAVARAAPPPRSRDGPARPGPPAGPARSCRRRPLPCAPR